MADVQDVSGTTGTPPIGSVRTTRGLEHRLRRMGAGVALLCALMGAAWTSVGHAQATARDSTATLVWTAPGDDGTSGRAARYEMRFRNVPITGADTLSWWNAATVVAGMPSPSVAGATDSVSVRGLAPAQTWYFVLRTADEVPNWSNFSNLAIRGPYVDRIAPFAIADLMTGGTSALPVLPPVEPNSPGR